MSIQSVEVLHGVCYHQLHEQGLGLGGQRHPLRSVRYEQGQIASIGCMGIRSTSKEDGKSRLKSHGGRVCLFRSLLKGCAPSSNLQEQNSDQCEGIHTMGPGKIARVSIPSPLTL